MEIITESIGTSDACDIVLPAAKGLAPHHATLCRCGGRIFLRGEESGRSTRINGRKIPAGRWSEIAKGDRIRLGELEIEVGARLFYGERRFRLLARDLIRKSEKGKILSEAAGLTVRPGEVVAVMGPSGAGKTMLLEMLSGTVAPDSGVVWLDDAKGGAWAASAANGIGFVPQHDPLVPDLTVGESLGLRLRLQFPDMTARIRDILTRDSCRSLGLGGGSLDTFLKRRIGDREKRNGGGLSGGELRRLAIAHELVGQAAVLVLDEPTSGLSSVEAERVLEVLRTLSREKAIPVILSLHQPGRDAFAKVDRLLLVGPGGRLLFDGAPSGAVAAIEAIREDPCGDMNPAEYILAATVDPAVRATLEAASESGASGARPEIPESVGETADSSSDQTPLQPGCFRCFLLRTASLAAKSYRVLVANPLVPSVMLAQALGIGLLMVLALHGYQQDESERNHFLSVAQNFHTLKAPFEEQGLPVPVDRLMREAEELAVADHKEARMLDPSTASRRGAVYFLLATASIWFGLIASCREVVSEARAFQTDVRAGRHSVLAYLLSKMVVLSVFSAVGVIVLALVAIPAILDLTFLAAAKVTAVLCLATSASVALGLAVSGFSRTSRIALTLVPLLILPQLLFSGFLRPIGADRSGEETGAVEASIREAISKIMLQRWVFAACLEADPYARQGVTDYRYETDSETRYSKLNRLTFSETGLVEQFFPGRDSKPHEARRVVAWLIGAIFAAWLACRFRARRGGFPA